MLMLYDIAVDETNESYLYMHFSPISTTTRIKIT